MKVFQILGVKFHNLTIKEAISVVERFVALRKPHIICNPNVHNIMITMKDSEFRRILNECDLSLADGMGVVYASRFLGTPLKERISGRLLLPFLCELSVRNGYKLYFLGAEPGVAKKAAQVLQSEYLGLKIVGTYSPSFDFFIDQCENEKILQDIRCAQPDILFVAFGNPKQEKWIARNLHNLNVPVCIPVGSTFDVIAGRAKQPPKWMSKLGLEWIFRIVQEPKRLGKRYLIENPLFLFYLIKLKLGWKPSFK
jgi:N-acetylglucosaminyldiphosphoundecaprenol N-acetyl-beta-D-mannosaminyltransferase